MYVGCGVNIPLIQVERTRLTCRSWNRSRDEWIKYIHRVSYQDKIASTNTSFHYVWGLWLFGNGRSRTIVVVVFFSLLFFLFPFFGGGIYHWKSGCIQQTCSENAAAFIGLIG